MKPNKYKTFINEMNKIMKIQTPEEELKEIMLDIEEKLDLILSKLTPEEPIDDITV